MNTISIDWQQLCLNLRKVVPTKIIAEKLGVSASCINNIAAGNVTDPQFSVGVNLLNLHYDHVETDKHKRLFK